MKEVFVPAKNFDTFEANKPSTFLIAIPEKDPVPPGYVDGKNIKQILIICFVNDEKVNIILDPYARVSEVLDFILQKPDSSLLIPEDLSDDHEHLPVVRVSRIVPFCRLKYALNQDAIRWSRFRQEFVPGPGFKAFISNYPGTLELACERNSGSGYLSRDQLRKLLLYCFVANSQQSLAFLVARSIIGQSSNIGNVCDVVDKIQG